ncbi:MAG TPA: hypothetical protein VK209_03630, partial [Candidatus Sulfotelmatobacter sp.]|nr:hypothetical protein [Candidatus Sulfotelmatobacter sp.]
MTQVEYVNGTKIFHCDTTVTIQNYFPLVSTIYFPRVEKAVYSKGSEPYLVEIDDYRFQENNITIEQYEAT